MPKKIFFIILLFLFACRQEENNGAYSIDSDVIFKSPQPIPLSQIAKKIDYIKLETRPDALLGGGCGIVIRDSFIIAGSFNSPVYIFEYPSGKFKFKIKGFMDRGPLGYNGSDLYSATPQGEILLYKWNECGVWSYKTGKFLYSIPVRPYKYNPLYFINDTLIIGVLQNFRDVPGSFLNVLSSKTGKVVRKLGFFSEWDVNSGYYTASEAYTYKYENDIVHYFYKCDTIYTIHKSDLSKTPRFILNLKDKLPPDNVNIQHNFNDYITVSGISETPKLLFLSISYKDKLHRVMYDKQTKQTHLYLIYTWEPSVLYGFENDLDGTVPVSPGSRLDSNRIYNVIDASLFVKYAGEEKAKQMGISEDDNPIIMIVTLK